jgi:hypothetical protein
MVYTYHSYSEGRDGMIVIWGQWEQKLARPYLKNKPGMVAQLYRRQR